MSAWKDWTTVTRSASTLVVLTLALATMDSHWMPTSGHATKTQLNLQKVPVEADSLLQVEAYSHQDGPPPTLRITFNVNGSLIFLMTML
jgi:hypothetical protein